MKRTLLLLACSLLAACSSSADNQAADSDAGAAPTMPGDLPGTVGTLPGAGDAGATVAPGDDGGSQPPPSSDPDAAAPVTDDAGSGTTPGTGVFGGDAGAYVATLGPSANSPKHAGNPNPAGQACLSCHGGQRPNVVRFLFAGTTWTSAAATTPAPQAEVRIVEANGVAHSAYSDANGNFFFVAAGETLAPPASGGARDANGEAPMVNVFNDGDCNSCHRTGGQAPISVP